MKGARGLAIPVREKDKPKGLERLSRAGSFCEFNAAELAGPVGERHRV